MSLSLRRAWIEIFTIILVEPVKPSRSPYGERGLKFDEGGHCVFRISRSPYGERGLKFVPEGVDGECAGRSPYGERGLKYLYPWQQWLLVHVALLTESVD